MNVAPLYSMRIAWSPKDQAYLVTLPEWSPRLLNQIAVTHGATYEEAARHGQEVLEMLIENAQDRGEPLPAPQLIEYADADDPDDFDDIDLDDDPTPAQPHPNAATA